MVLPVQDVSTAVLVARAAHGDQPAWNGLVERYGGLVHAVARSFRLSPADVADVFQTVWLRFAEHIDRLRDPDRAGAWLATTTRHECLRLLRTSARVVVSDELELDPDAEGQQTIEEMLEGEEERVAVREAFARLPEKCQRLLAMVIDPDLTYQDICLQLDMPMGSIGPTRGRYLKRLEDEIRAGSPGSHADPEVSP